MIQFFIIILYQPLFNLLIFLHKILPGHDLGIAIILLTLVIKLILYFPSLSSLKAQKNMQDINPKLEALKKKYKNDRQRMSQELVKFYKENKVNPFSSCLPLLIQLPILIALYRVFIAGLKTDPATGILVSEQLNYLYPSLKTIYSQTPISSMFLGIFDLAQPKNYLFAFLAAGFQYWQSRMLTVQKPKVKTEGAKDELRAANMTQQMTYMMPIITFIFALNFPAGLALYWTVSTLFMVIQQYIFFQKKKKLVEEKTEL